ncbi:MAG: SMP-30/gluconolactonase/LRE family protein, partial [Acidobacteriia bacterium]|nr:SMP-30/gluconolactonase/LRE family protein [Terriglobia bacterium]
YVPAQYDSAKSTPVMVFQDGSGYVREEGRWRATIVLDNLIHKKQMPPTIGIFIDPGVLPALGANQQPRFNRSFEYDAVSGRYARFLIEEILPEVAKKYNLSANPNDRALAGSSSGGIAAFTAAWHRPDAFRRVLSFIGSYTNLRGGNNYSSLVRKTEPKPLRVFLQDGSNDQNIYSGSWFLGNQDLDAALEYSGYDHTFVIGTEKHNSIHGSSILPDAMRWLWRDYPAPITNRNNTADRRFVTDILDPAENWELVSEGHKFTEGPAISPSGEVFFTDIPNNRIHKIDAAGKVTVFKEDSGASNGLMFGPDGKLYACQNGRKRIVAYSMDGGEKVIAEDVQSNDLVVTAKGDIYFTDPAGQQVWHVDSKGNKRVAHKGIARPNGVILSPDQSLLNVADSLGKFVWSFQIQPDGALAHGQAFHRLETWDDSSASGADGMTVDSEGYLYVATRLGLQICDQPGRTVGIIAKPHPGSLANAVFAGPDLKTIYVTAGDKVFRRKVRRHGVLPWKQATLPKPGL